jgi:hypothetical protein
MIGLGGWLLKDIFILGCDRHQVELVHELGQGVAHLDGPEPLLLEMVRPTKPGQQGWSRGGPGIIEQIDSPLLYLLARAFGKSPCRILPNTDLPEGRFDLLIRLPKSKDMQALTIKTQEHAKTSLLQAFGLKAETVVQEMDVLVLKAMLRDVRLRRPTSGFKEPTFVFLKFSTSRLCSLEMGLRSVT